MPFTRPVDKRTADQSSSSDARRLSPEPGDVSTVRVVELGGQFEMHGSERQFQMAFDSATWRYEFTLRLA